jgi:hypothetical protein
MFINEIIEFENIFRKKKRFIHIFNRKINID